MAVWTVWRSPGEKKKREKEKEMTKGVFKRTGNAHLGEEQTQGNEIVFGGPKERKGDKAFREGKNKLPENDSRTFLQDKGSDKEFQSNKGTSKDQSSVREGVTS